MKKQFSIWGTLAVLFFFPACGAFAQHKAPRAADKVHPLSQEEASERWREFSSSRPVADYCLDFTLTHVPRRDAESVYRGTLWGTEISADVVMRVIVKKDGDEKYSDFLLRAGKNYSEIIKFENGKAVVLGDEDWLKPVCDGLIYSVFDILMPYRFWNSVSYAGAGRIGQAVHYFDISAPKDFREKCPALRNVKVALSREFNSPVQTEIFGPEGVLLRTVTLDTFKKVDDLWIMLKIDIRDDVTRDKDKLKFTAAKLGTKLENKALIFNRAQIEKQGAPLPPKPLLENL